MTRTLRILQSTNNATATAAPPPEAVAVESDFVVILAALLCALICVVGLTAVARCAWLRRSSGTGSGAGVGYPRQSLANKGLKKKVLQTLPKFTYVDGNPNSSECAICLAEFAALDEVRVLPQCGHVFHVGCIDTWLGSHSSCPSCRALLAVARCQKCGQFPAVGGGGGRRGEAEVKSVENDNDNANGVANNCDVGNVVGGHSGNNGFLP